MSLNSQRQYTRVSGGLVCGRKLAINNGAVQLVKRGDHNDSGNWNWSLGSITACWINIEWYASIPLLTIVVLA